MKMLKRYIQTFIALVVLTAVYMLTLLPIIFLGSELQTTTYLTVLLVWFVFVFLSLFPALSLIVRSIWFFSGRGSAVPLEQVQKKILAVNNSKHAPVHVEEKKKKLIISWNYKDKIWCSFMQKAELNRLYELHVSFHAPTKTAFLSDRIRYLELFICPEEIKKGIIPHYRPYFRTSPAEKNGTLESLIRKPSHEFSFLPREIKSPVMATILQSGWNVRYTLF